MLTDGTALVGARWRKSSRTNAGNNAQCVELACLSEMGAVRDSKNQAGPCLFVPTTSFRAFLTASGQGALDLIER
ncbi:DUF397 domain-containing protein [Actinokineospora enzanensis]|uniref:DUF397 domain-containing protein n=1 Tax=Actinokineospora enzanensis TaxID=155975 RepID=UPI000476BE46|nr:DUF397 domain-containing protein [Actinokineospora enzanensis]